MVLETIRNHIEDLVKSHIQPENMLTDQDYEDITKYANDNLLRKKIKLDKVKELNENELIDELCKKVIDEYESKFKDIPQEITNEFEKVISLQILDNYWMEEINTMAHLREGIYLRGYGQEDPLRAYSIEGYNLFDKMLQNVDRDVTVSLLKSEIRQNIERKEKKEKLITNDPDKGDKKQPKKVGKKIGRNDPCPCGSGKKYKQCHGK